jgi:hypothetical protein
MDLGQTDKFQTNPRELFSYYYDVKKANLKINRLNSLYCYDLRENPEFQYIKKVDDKIKAYYGI